ncbi:MAG: hypothetical protein KBT06_12260 [Prevotellaceae bacterium]|nr:hypothetical protein [Candidatus Colivivens equi]
MGISRDDIKGNYSEALVTNLCFRVAETGDFLGFVKEYMYDDDPIVVRNALSALSKATDEELSQLNPIKDELMDMAIRCNNSSVRRALFGIIFRLEMNEEDIRTDFLDHCLEKMADPNEVSSIQALCMKLAYKLCKFYPELLTELKRALEAMEISYYTPAVKNVRSKILNKKYKE